MNKNSLLYLIKIVGAITGYYYGRNLLDKINQTSLDLMSIMIDFNNKGLEIAKIMQSNLNKLDIYLAEVKKSNSNFISDFSFIWDFDLNIFYNFLDSLTFQQEGALFHILVFITMLLTIFSLLGVFIGNEIIKYFDLEKKLPRLSTFFKVRATLQRYYLVLNLFILLALCIVGIGINIIVFIAG